MSPFIARALANKHTTGAGALFLGLKVVCEIAVVWFPDKKDQIEHTSKILEGAAMFYGMMMAGDSKQSVTHQELDTAVLCKSSLPPGAPGPNVSTQSTSTINQKQ